MLVYKPQSKEVQKIINNINQPITEQNNYNSEWTLTKEDKIYMAVSSITFAVVLIITAFISIP